MTAADPTMRALVAKIAAGERWARQTSPQARRDATAAAREGRMKRYYDRVDPDRTLPEAERIRAAEQLRRVDMQRMALRSAQVRKRKVA